MLTRRAEDVPEIPPLGSRRALNLPDVALGDEPLLVVALISTFCRLCLARYGASSFADVLDHGRSDSSCSTSTNRSDHGEMARFSGTNTNAVDDVAAHQR